MPFGKSSCQSLSLTLGSSSELFLRPTVSTKASPSSGLTSKRGATKVLEHHTWCARDFLKKRKRQGLPWFYHGLPSFSYGFTRVLPWFYHGFATSGGLRTHQYFV